MGSVDLTRLALYDNMATVENLRESCNFILTVSKSESFSYELKAIEFVLPLIIC
jgi:hypothetical protein